MSDICKNAKKLIQDGHPDHIAIESVSKEVDKKWEQLMLKAKERREVVFSSYNFYRSAENVSRTFSFWVLISRILLLFSVTKKAVSYQL